MRRLDLTKGSILKQLIKLSIPIVFSMFMLTLYFVADLWFVGRLGPSAVAVTCRRVEARSFHATATSITSGPSSVWISMRVGAALTRATSSPNGRLRCSLSTEHKWSYSFERSKAPVSLTLVSAAS